MKTSSRKARCSSFSLLLLFITLFLGSCAPPPPNLTPTPTGTPPAAPTVNFGEVYIHTTKTAPMTVTWTNGGGSPGNVDRIDITGADAGNFGATPSPFTAAVNSGAATPAVTFTFSPTAVRDYTATGTPHLTQANATATGISLQGSGRAQRALGALTFFGGNLQAGRYLNFRRVAVGATSVNRTFNLKNLDQNNPITISSIVFQVGGQGFRVTTPAATPFTIPADGQVLITMTFTPPNFPQPPREKIFADGVTFQDAAGANLFGTALCGVGFHPPDPPDTPVTFCP